MAARRTRPVLSDGVPIACRDHAGTGPDLVLMHGAGMQQRSLDRLVRHLVGDFHIVTFDFRGHGATPMAPWTMDTAISDLEAVIEVNQLQAPVVAGHSLGGMVAAEYARRNPACTAAINLDGHWLGTPDQYVGKDPAAAARWIDAQQARARDLVDGRLARALRLVGRLRGVAPAHPEAIAAIMTVVRDLDLIALYREVGCPLQVFNAHTPSRALAAWLVSDPEQMAAAQRAGIQRDLGALSRSNPNVVLTELDASHMLIRTHPAQTAALMTAFLRDRGLLVG